MMLYGFKTWFTGPLPLPPLPTVSTFNETQGARQDVVTDVNEAYALRGDVITINEAYGLREDVMMNRNEAYGPREDVMMNTNEAYAAIRF